MNRTVNLRALVTLLLAVPALFVGVHFLHAYQMRRGARDLLEQADRAEADGRAEDARGFLHDYLELEPDDDAVQARYGRALKESARSRDEYQRAYRALARAVQLNPAAADVRRQAATLAADLGRFAEAKEQAQALQAESPRDGEVECLLGRCEEAAGQYAEAVRWYADAEKHAPQREEAYLRHAYLLRGRLRTPAAADEVVRAMTAANPGSAPTRLAAARYYARYGSLEDAGREAAAALGKPGADGADAYLLAAAVEEARGRRGPARERIAEGLGKHPADAGLNLAAARIDLQAGRRDEARVSLRHVAEAAEASPGQLTVLGDLLLDLDDVPAAGAAVARVSERKGASAPRLEARLRMREGEWGKARVLLERLRGEKLLPAEARQVEMLLGSCYEHLDDPEAALAAYRRALKDDPFWPPASRGEIGALLGLGRLDDAEQAYRRAAAGLPELNLGLARLLLVRQLRRPAAERQWSGVEAALGNVPESLSKEPETRRLRAELLQASGRADEARRLMEAERDRHPDQVGPRLTLARFAVLRGDAKGADQILREAEARQGRSAEVTLARIELAAKGEPAAARKALAELEASSEGLAGEDGLRVLRGLAEAYTFLGDTARAGALWRKVAGAAPRDLGVRLRLLEIAYRTGDIDGIEKVVAEIRPLEGAGGGLAAWGEAARRVLLGEKGDRSQLAEAHRRLVEARARRPR
jgi:tetratricopeptide (TPR) repeat protein